MSLGRILALLLLAMAVPMAGAAPAQAAETDRPVTGLEGIPGVRVREATQSTVRLDVQPDRLDEVVRHLSAAGIRNLVSTPPTLEELFLQHYGDELAEDGVAVDAAPRS